MESVVALEMTDLESPSSPRLTSVGLAGNKLELFSGFVAGVAGIVTGHPLDTVRIRQQVAPSSQGAFSRLFSIVKTEGALAPFRGMLPPLLASGAQNALLFATYAPTKDYLASNAGAFWGVRSPLAQAFVAGCVAGSCQTIVASPAELVKIRMQASSSKFASSFQCLADSIRTQGIRNGLYKGFSITFLRDSPNIGIYFCSYEWIKGLLLPKDGRLFVGNLMLSDNVAVLLAGGTAGILSWALSYPVDVIKSRYQNDTRGFYQGVGHAVTHSIRTHGWKILFQGFSACMYRAFLVNAVTFVAFEEAKRRCSI